MKHDKYIMGYLSMNINGILMEHDTMEIHGMCSLNGKYPLVI